MRHREKNFEEVTLGDVGQAALIFKPERFTSTRLYPDSAKVPPPRKGAKKNAGGNN
jgi:hypothetical protein